MLELLILAKWYFLGLVVIVLYAFIVWRVRIVLLPVRIYVSEVAYRLRHRDGVTPYQRARVDVLVDTAANGWCAWVFIVLVPVALVITLLRQHKFMAPAEPLFRDAAGDRELTKLHLTWFLSVWLSSPAAAFIVALELLVYVALTASSSAAAIGAEQISELVLKLMDGRVQKKEAAELSAR